MLELEEISSVLRYPFSLRFSLDQIPSKVLSSFPYSCLQEPHHFLRVLGRIYSPRWRLLFDCSLPVIGSTCVPVLPEEFSFLISCFLRKV